MHLAFIFMTGILLQDSLIINPLPQKILNMYKLSLYGDALGAPTEGSFNSVKIMDLKPAVYFHGHSANQWGMWASPQSYKNASVGLVTDDSFYKAFVLQRYRLWMAINELPPTDLNFSHFLVSESNLLKRKNYPFHSENSSFQRMLTQHIADWLGMMQQMICPNQNDYCFAEANWAPALTPQQSFYQPGKAVCFGFFMFLPLVDHYLGLSDMQIFETFFHITNLDDHHAPLATGVAALVLAKALTHHSTEQNAAEWISDQFNKALTVAEASPSVHPEHLQALREVLNHVRKTADNIAPLNFEQARKTLYQIRKTQLPYGVTGLKFDPLEFIHVLLTTLRYGNGDMEKSFLLIINSGGDTDTIAALLGLLVGAYYGNNWSDYSEKMQSEITATTKTFTENFSFSWGQSSFL